MSDRVHMRCFDSLRLMAGLCVVFMHTAAGLLREGINPDWHLLNICTSFAFTAVPLFLMMSGYLLLTGEKTASWRVLFCQRLPRLLVPLVGWTGVAVLWSCFRAGTLTPAALLRGMLSAIVEPAAVHFWFLYVLILLYLLSPLLYRLVRRLGRGGRLGLLVLIAAVSAAQLVMALGNIPPLLPDTLLADRLRQLGRCGCIFLLGYLLGTTEKKIPVPVLLVTAAVTLAFISGATFLRSRSAGAYVQDFQNQQAGAEILLASCLFLLFRQNAGKKPVRPGVLRVENTLLALSMPVYMMHNIFLSMLFCRYCPGSFAGVLATTLGVYAACVLVMKTVATVRPLCYLATGMRYDKASASCNWVYTLRRREKG